MSEHYKPVTDKSIADINRDNALAWSAEPRLSGELPATGEPPVGVKPVDTSHMAIENEAEEVMRRYGLSGAGLVEPPRRTPIL